MKISHTICRLALGGALALALGACDRSFVYDYEGDCDPDYRVRLKYDWNLKFADAFPAEVSHVTLNVVDSDGNIVHTHTESGEALAADGYEIVLDDIIKPGKYRLHAWCGGGAEPGNKSFAVHPASKLDELRCTLLPDEPGRADITGAEGTEVSRDLKGLYHGLTAELDFPEDEGVHTYTVPLKKNTNAIKVVLQHLSGTPIDGNDFDITITSANARMAHDNSIIDAAPVVYKPWDIRNGKADINPDDPNTGGVYSATVAEFTTARLMADEKVRLQARRKSDGKLVFSVDMIDMALLVKSANLRSMDDQEYLDRCDDYNFIFFLDANYRWTKCYINILSWTVVEINKDI
ncbi:MAG: FimB/Mfa2 family fimbrial subunit [Muribaculaceae bacterium]|nr:FimB/Mfa2 family fimbrial subunit [Muribaculaceae bacterium]